MTFKKNDYTKFLLNAGLLLLMVWLIDVSAGALLRHYYFSQKKGNDSRAVYSIEKADADLMIYGSSRGARNYHPEVFEKKTGAFLSQPGKGRLFHAVS